MCMRSGHSMPPSTCSDRWQSDRSSPAAPPAVAAGDLHGARKQLGIIRNADEGVAGFHTGCRSPDAMTRAFEPWAFMTARTPLLNARTPPCPAIRRLEGDLEPSGDQVREEGKLSAGVQSQGIAFRAPTIQMLPVKPTHRSRPRSSEAWTSATGAATGRNIEVGGRVAAAGGPVRNA
jgi:hypothetical protein